MSETMKATFDRYAHLAIHLENFAGTSDFGFNIARDLWAAMKLGQAELDELTAQRAEAWANAERWRAELEECQSALRLALAGTEQHYSAAPARIDDVRAALAEAEAELAKLKPYALATIGQLRLVSISTELEDAEDAQEYRAVARKLRDWENISLRLGNLMRARWEQDRMSMVRIELANMAEAAANA